MDQERFLHSGMVRQLFPPNLCRTKFKNQSKLFERSSPGSIKRTAAPTDQIRCLNQQVRALLFDLELVQIRITFVS